ncbi:MAG: flavin reductase family protein, partial [Gaiellales bacterium]
MGTAPLDGDLYRRAIGRFATGVTIVTALHEGRRLAMTANSLTSASIDPPLVLVCFMHDSETGAAVRASRRFALNVLDADRGPDLARRCAAKAEPGRDQLADVRTRDGPFGMPLIEGALECLSCEVNLIRTVGDHDLVIAAGAHLEPAHDGTEPL